MEKVKEFAKHNLDELRWWHTQHVVKLALEIADREKADKEIVEVAAWLHDIGFSQGGANNINHHEYSIKLANKLFAEINYPSNKVDKVIGAIRQHMPDPRKPSVAAMLKQANKDSDYLPRPQTIEAKVLFDADMIDACGPWGVVKIFMLAGKQGKDVKESIGFAMVVQDSFNDLQTATGKQLGERYRNIAYEFLEQLK